MSNEITVVVASVDPMKTLPYWSSFRKRAAEPFRLVLVVGGQGETLENLPKELAEYIQENDSVVLRGIDGVIPAYFAGVREAYAGETEPKIIACFHDDLEILEEGWDARIREVFQDEKVLLAGFGGGTGLGSADIYASPYSPFQLARQDFVSNLVDAEAHGRRSTKVEKVACLDGLAQIGRGDFIYECYASASALGIVHHFYDSLFGGWCHAAGFEARMIPVLAKHYGGMSAVGSKEYNEWAKLQNPEGDQGFWNRAHEIGYEELKGVVPFSVKE